MMGVSVVLIVLLVLCQGDAAEHTTNENCIKSYQDLEMSVIERPSNMDAMNLAFSPPNRQAGIAAEVYYFFNDRNTSLNTDITSYDYAFRWSSSPIFNLMRPELLHQLSLFVYHGGMTTIKIVVDPLCVVPSFNSRLLDEEACSGGASTSDSVRLLNQLTTNVSPRTVTSQISVDKYRSRSLITGLSPGQHCCAEVSPGTRLL